MRARSIYSLAYAIAIASLASAAMVQGAILQTVAGPVVSGGGGEGTTLIDTSNDTGDWITAFNAGGGTIYLSFDWTIDNNAGETGSGGFFGGLGIYDSTFGERLLLGNGWTQLSYSGGTGAAGISDTGIPYEVGNQVRIVGRLSAVNDGTNNDSWHMWVNPLNGDEGSPQAGSTTFTIDDFTKLTSRAGNAPGQATLSNLVIADTWNDVVPVPEPGSAALVVLAGSMLVLRRRR